MTALADALIAARRSNRTLDAAPWTDALQDAAQAYEVQDAVAAALDWFGDEGAVPGHWKSGGGSRSVTLTHAPLPPSGVRQSPANFDDLVFHTPGIESEIALRLGQPEQGRRGGEVLPARIDDFYGDGHLVDE